jgi:hypothetical protein
MARYAQGLLLAEIGESRKATEVFEELVSNYAEVAGETGLPLLPLAQLKLLEIATNYASKPGLDSFCSNIVYSPTVLTPMLLAEAKKSEDTSVEKWRLIWEQHERARELYNAACGKFGGAYLSSQKVNPWSRLGPRLFWFEPEDLTAEGMPEKHEKWLAVRCQEQNVSCWFVCKSVTQVNREMGSVAGSLKQIPEYFGIDFELAGRRFIRSSTDLQLWTEHHHGGKGGGWDKDYSEKIASDSERLASAVHADEDGDILRVNV